MTNLEISELLGAGRFDEAYEHVDELVGRFEAKDIVEATVARLLHSMVVLPRMDTQRVLEVWRPLLSGEPASPNDTELMRLRDALKDDLLFGLVLAELGNTMYRMFQPNDGYPISQQAVEILEQTERSPALGPEHQIQSKLLSRVWLARLCWQRGERPSARKKVNAVLDDIASHQSDTEHFPGLDLVEAIALDVLSDFAAIEGKTEPALAHIRQAMVLAASARDRCRVGHIHYLYGKIVTPQTRDAAAPLRLFRQAAHLYPDGHPFRYRAINQEVQVLARVDALDKAESRLSFVQDELANDKTISRPQREYCERELALTRFWILERRAKERDDAWQECLAHAEEVREKYDWEQHPPRHAAELQLHYGRALAHCKRVQDAVVILTKGLDLVQNASVKIALQFALADAFARSDQDSKARRAWREGHTLRHDGIPSRFLREWDESLAQRIGDVTVNVDEKHKVALRSFERQYLDHHLFKAKSKAEFDESTGLARSTTSGLLKRHGQKEAFADLPTKIEVSTEPEG